MDHTSPTVDKDKNQQEEVPMGRTLGAQKDDMALLHEVSSMMIPTVKPLLYR